MSSPESTTGHTETAPESAIERDFSFGETVPTERFDTRRNLHSLTVLPMQPPRRDAVDPRGGSIDPVAHGSRRTTQKKQKKQSKGKGWKSYKDKRNTGGNNDGNKRRNNGNQKQRKNK